MLKFIDILKGVQQLVKGYTFDKMEEAVNAGQNMFAMDFHMPFLVREYYIILSQSSSDNLGPFTVYEDSDGNTEADWLVATSHPVKTHINGVVDSYGRRVRFRQEGQSLYLIDDGWAAGSYSFWCLKTPVQYVKESVDTNMFQTDTDFPLYCKQALIHAIAAFLMEYKKDYNKQKYFDDLYRLNHAPRAKKLALGDHGIRNSGDTSKSDEGVDLGWC